MRCRCKTSTAIDTAAHRKQTGRERATSERHGVGGTSDRGAYCEKLVRLSQQSNAKTSKDEQRRPKQSLAEQSAATQRKQEPAISVNLRLEGGNAHVEPHPYDRIRDVPSSAQGGPKATQHARRTSISALFPRNEHVHPHNPHTPHTYTHEKVRCVSIPACKRC